MPTVISQERPFSRLSHIQRMRCQPSDLYEVIFLDHQDRIVVPLTEWYHQRQAYGSRGTRETYLTCLLPYLSFLIEQECPWNAPPERLRPALIAFYRDRLGCQLHPRKDQECVDVALTRETPVCASTLRVMRAALRDFYCVLKDAGMYAFANPLSSETLIALKREQMQTLANRGAPDHAGIRGETREQSRRRPTAFLHHSEAQGWKPELRKELADVREGMHRVLDALIDSQTLPLREKAVLELLRNTGASKRPRLVELLHEARAERDEAKRQLKAERSENKQRTQAARADLEQRYHKLLQEHMTCGITIAKLEAQVAEYLAFLERFRSALQREEHS